MNEPRKGGSYIRDKDTGALTTVFQPGQTEPDPAPRPDAKPAKKGPRNVA